MFRLRLSGAAIAAALLHPCAFAASPSQPEPLVAQAGPAPVAAAAPPASAASAATQRLDRVEITAQRQRLDAARNSLSPETGSTIYRFSPQDIANLPLGDSTPLNQVILRSPGVVQDSYGQLHVRGDHANVQYRINGVIVPESISGFGQALETPDAAGQRFIIGVSTPYVAADAGSLRFGVECRRCTT